MIGRGVDCRLWMRFLLTSGTLSQNGQTGRTMVDPLAQVGKVLKSGAGETSKII